MTNSCRTETRDGIGVIFMHRAPSNARSAQMVQHVQAQILALLDDPAILGLVLTTDLGHFSAGSDSAELTHPTPNSKQALAALCDVIDAAAKPVVVAVRGGCLGPGLELALAARAPRSPQPWACAGALPAPAQSPRCSGPPPPHAGRGCVPSHRLWAKD